MRKDRKAYEQMYALIRPVVRHKQVLGLATGTGLIAGHIVRSADHMDAFCRRLKEMGYAEVRMIDTTDGMFMTKKEAGRLMLQGSTLLVGRK